VHCASGRTGDADAARNLVQAAARASVAHLVYISIVGSDKISDWRDPAAGPKVRCPLLSDLDAIRS